jgi:hypothetical protein
MGMREGAPLASCTVTNVPGPAIPLYLMARATAGNHADFRRYGTGVRGHEL